MDLKLQAVHFDISEKLEAFIAKKTDKLSRRFPAVASVNCTLKVVKPESAMNKQAVIEVKVPQEETLVADKTADTFEEAIDMCLEAVERRLEKLKDRH